ncbi:MAG: hypothetical protein IKA71_09130 [Lentisphaeria bacterium]|nr:hypothetical protein [Lentisphaeria bacterium]
MNKIIPVSALALICTALSAGVVSNADFESGDLSSWASRQQPYGQVELFKVIPGGNNNNSGGYHLKSSGDKNNRFNNFITLVQDIKTIPSAKKTYVFGGFAQAEMKSSAGKFAKFSIREVDADGKTVAYQDIPVNPHNAQYTLYEKFFTPSPRTRQLQFYLVQSGMTAEDSVYWDNIFFSEFGNEKPFAPEKKKNTARTLTLQSDGITAHIDMASGLLDSLLSGSEVIHPAAADNSVIFIRINGKPVTFKCGKKAPVRKGSSIVAELLPAEKNIPFKADVEYKISNGFFTEKIIFTALEAVNTHFQIGVRHGFNSKAWEKIICALYPARVIDAGESTLFSYSEKENDRNRTMMDQYQYPVYPLTMLKSERGILLAGSFDLDKFVTISPNHPQGYFPSLQKNPLSAKKGEKFEFVYNCRFYPADRYWLRDVWREYCKNIYSNNPMIKDFVPYKERPYRNYFRGAHAGSTFFMASREAKLSPNSNIWWFGWLDWAHETYPVSGSWWNKAVRGEWHKTSAEQMKAEITRLQNKGHKLALYCRQLANLNLKGSKFPESWFKHKAGGSLDIYAGALRIKISPEMQKEFNWQDIPWGTYNFDNQEFNDFYVKQILTAVDYYDPKAVGWDMAWRPDHPGIFAAQARIFKCMREKYPDKKVATNECGGSPTIFYSDLVMLENGALGGRDEYNYEFIKAFGNAMVCIERSELFKGAVILNMTNGKSSWLSAKGLALNKKYLDHILKLQPELRENQQELALRCQLRMNLLDQALGASPGYMEGLPRLPEKMLTMAQDSVSIPLIVESFVVRLPNGKDRMNPLYASAWLNEKSARTVIYNDNTIPEKFTLRLQKKYFRKFNWNKADLATGEAFFLNPEKNSAAKLTWDENDQDIIVSGVLPPFTAAYIFSEKR